MKHIVKVTYSDPTHDFMSMKGRTKSTNYVVEARNDNEAQLRASSYFRSMGYKIHSATIVEQKKEVPAAPAVLKEEAEQVDEVNSRYDMTQALTPKSSNVKAAVGTTARDKAATNKYARRISKLTGGEYSKQDVKDHLKSLANEETSYIEEKLSVSDGVDKWIHDFVHSDNPKFEGKSKKERIQQALGAYYAAKRGTNEEVEHIEEGFNKSSPAHMKARDLVSRSSMKAVYHSDGSATIHTTGDKNVSSATKVDHIHRDAGLDHNKPASAYKNSTKSKGGLTFKTKENEGSHQVHISYKGMKEEVEQVEEAHKVGDKVMVKKELSDEKEDMVGTVHAVRGAEVTVKLPKDRGNITVLHREVKKVNEEGDMSPAVKAAQAKFDAQTKAQQQKPVQAGTLAAKAKREGQVAEQNSNVLGVIKAAAKSKTLAKQASPKIELGLSKENPLYAQGPHDDEIKEAAGDDNSKQQAKKMEVNKEVKSTEKETEVAKAKENTTKKKKNQVILHPSKDNVPHVVLPFNPLVSPGGSSGSGM